MKALITMLIVTQAIFVMSQISPTAQNTGTNNLQSKSDSLSYLIITNNAQYGYDIFRNGKLLIHQPHIPGRNGQHGFENKTDAKKVALLVISKLKKGIFPPSVTEEEMKNLDVRINKRQ